jgi:membrane protein DedA with SNARE-associated domain
MVRAMLSHLLEQAVEWSVLLVHKTGYPGIAFLMFLESTFVPFPSELVMPQAGWLAKDGEMNIVIAILMGTIGSCLGAMTNYGLALWLGRPFFQKFGKYLLCPPESFAKVEKFFVRHGEIGTFTGRLIPGIRHLISLPAGLARMNIPRFQFFTALGAGIWCTILAVIGYIARGNWDLIKEMAHKWTLAIILCAGAIIALYVWWDKRRTKHQS